MSWSLRGHATLGGLKIASDIGGGGGGDVVWEESRSDKSENGCWCPRCGLFSIEVLLPCRNRSTSLIGSHDREKREEYIRILLKNREKIA